MRGRMFWQVVGSQQLSTSRQSKQAVVIGCSRMCCCGILNIPLRDDATLSESSQSGFTEVEVCHRHDSIHPDDRFNILGA